MTQDLKGKVAIVTGGSGGIGKAITQNLTRRGASVVINYKEKNPHEFVESLKKEGANVVAIQADITKVSEIRKIFEEAVKHFGGLDILVNNAGVYNATPIIKVTEEEYDASFNVNAKSVFFAIQEAAKIIHDNGRIVNISTALTKSTNISTTSIYTGAKGAIEQFTKGAALELASKKVTVNTVSPGVINTEMVANFPESVKNYCMSLSVFNRLGETEEIAELVGFLVSDKARWITGQNFNVDGGATMTQ